MEIRCPLPKLSETAIALRLVVAASLRIARPSSGISSLTLALLLGASGGMVGPGQFVQAASLSHWQYQPQTGRLSFDLMPGEKPRYFLMANPMRIVVDLPGRHREAKALEAGAGGVITKIQVSDVQVAGMTRLTLELAPGTVLQSKQVDLVSLDNGRWSLRPLLAAVPGERLDRTGLAEGSSVPAVEAAVEVEVSAALPVVEAAVVEAAVVEAAVGKTVVNDAVIDQAGLEPVEDFGAEELRSEEFVSMEETLARQQDAVADQSQVAASAQPSEPEERPWDVPAVEPAVAIQWGSSQLPPVPEASGRQAVSDVVGQPVSAELGMQLPEPRLGQAPLVSNSLLSDRALVDPARMVDTRRLLTPALRLTTPVEPAPVEPTVDPKLLRLNDAQQSAVTLGGGDLSSASASRPKRVRQAQLEAPQSTAVQVSQPVQAQTTASQPRKPESSEGDASVPFLVEFGAPVPDLQL